MRSFISYYHPVLNNKVTIGVCAAQLFALLFRTSLTASFRYGVASLKDLQSLVVMYKNDLKLKITYHSMIATSGLEDLEYTASTAPRDNMEISATDKNKSSQHRSQHLVITVVDS
jgi:hypothetical protein